MHLPAPTRFGLRFGRRRPSTSASPVPEASTWNPDDRSLDKLVDVLRHLPSGPFTRNSFLVHAIGLNAIESAAQIDLILDRLASLGLIYRFGSQVDTWAVMNQVKSDPSPRVVRAPAAAPSEDNVPLHH